jgi:Putative amidoligase enzyme
MREVRYIKFDSRRAFGLEMEFNKIVSQEALHLAINKADTKHRIERSSVYQQDYSNNYWHIKFDRSCGDKINEGGWEVASYKAKGYADLENIVKAVGEIQATGAKCNNNCAVHVHVEINDFAQGDAAALVANWMKIEPIVLEMVPAHRRSNIYCVPLTEKFKNIDKRKAYSPPEFWSIVRPVHWDNNSRRMALNMVNYAQSIDGRVTTEIRLPEGSCDPNDIKNWIRFFVHFVDWSKEVGFPKDIHSVKKVDEVLALCGLHYENPFFILSRSLRNTKMWFLKRLQTYSKDKLLLEQVKNRLDIMSNNTPMQIIPNEKRPPEELPSKWLKRIAEKYRRLKQQQDIVSSCY